MKKLLFLSLTILSLCSFSEQPVRVKPMTIKDCVPGWRYAYGLNYSTYSAAQECLTQSRNECAQQYFVDDDSQEVLPQLNQNGQIVGYQYQYRYWYTCLQGKGLCCHLPEVCNTKTLFNRFCKSAMLICFLPETISSIRF